MTFGEEGNEQARVYDLQECQKILDIFKSHGHDELDSARMYADGTTEKYLKRLNIEAQGFKVATKNFPSARFQKLLDALEAKQIPLYYLHAPDRETPFDDTVQALKKEHEQGHYDRLGISNFTAAEVANFCDACKKHDLPPPSVYQGLYNAICRSADPELLTELRKQNMSYYIYNPLGGGFFVGHLSNESPVEAGSRFDPKRGQGQAYRARYWNDAYFNALEKLKPICAANNHHNALSNEKGDAIIIGDSSTNHIDQNLKDLEGPPLPTPVIDALDHAWMSVKAVGAAPRYHF
ncbi:Aldo/keto reductase [Tilletiaria anomala UBC 951]|uniref:Aldo/keto reductase n=1 Tax=Tilletiaria anomala (strain ATCC 24038 / CBS 436.72 / UBC 951) TaxID=1037660 RepID=A0A066W774_TILAU|nr:Aldo/keto reductase [Tilletiaria anomala UBC 951]KDN49601.1 Aldo/keto reductase [Tilletiaria anomala UBC 951]